MTDVTGLENQLEKNKELIERRDLALRLSKNHDFKKLIMEDFMVKECAAYAHTSGDPSRTQEERADALALAQAGGHLKRYLQVCVGMGYQAESQMTDLEEQLSMARSEEDAA